MPTQQSPESNLPAVISVSAMARKCRLSRSRFYQLVEAGMMPTPCYDPRTRRPIYTQEHQRQCLSVRATNIGMDGRFIVFYERRNTTPLPSPTSAPRRERQRRPLATSPGRHRDMIEQLGALGLTSVTDGDIDAALETCFPAGIAGVEEGERLRTLWQHLRRTRAA